MVLLHQPKQRRDMLKWWELDFQDLIKTFKFYSIQIMFSPSYLPIKWFEFNQKSNQQFFRGLKTGLGQSQLQITVNGYA